MYAGDVLLPLPSIKKRKHIYLYDKDIFVNQWKEILFDINNRNPTSIRCIHPVICKTLTHYFTIRKFSKFSRSNIVYLDLNIPSDEIHYMLKKYKNQFLEDITISSQVGIPIGGDYPRQQMYVDDFIYKINLLYSFWSYNIPIKIFLRKNSRNFNNPLYHTEKKLAILSCIKKKEQMDHSLMDKIPKKKKDNPLLQEYLWLLDRCDGIRDLFNQNFNKIKQNGEWRI